MSLDYADVPLPASPFGEARYRAGRALVAEHGIRPAALIWDADEVLWDWVMDLSRMLPRLPRALLRRDLGHREYFRVKPGMFELLWGLHHEARARGLDPYLRIWTNGYAWRAWRIAQEIPGMADLLGPPHATAGDFADHPRLFCRADYTAAALRLLPSADPGPLFDAMPPLARALIAGEIGHNPLNSHLKIPELAAVLGKRGFGEAAILIDDRPQNIARFVATGRRGILIRGQPMLPHRGRVRNLTWRDPARELARLSGGVAASVETHLRRLGRNEAGPSLTAHPTGHEVGRYPYLDFTLDIPDHAVRSEWVVPLRALRAAVKAEKTQGPPGAA